MKKIKWLENIIQILTDYGTIRDKGIPSSSHTAACGSAKKILEISPEDNKELGFNDFMTLLQSKLEELLYKQDRDRFTRKGNQSGMY